MPRLRDHVTTLGNISGHTLLRKLITLCTFKLLMNLQVGRGVEWLRLEGV